MNIPLRTIAALGLLMLPALSRPQEPAASEDRWAIGAGAALIDSPYAGEGARVRPFPLVTYNGERFFLRGISGGVHLHESRTFVLDALVAARLDGFDIEDFGRAELLANGLAADLLSDRDDGIDLGMRASYRSTLGALTLEAMRDVSGASEGLEISLDYGYTWRFDRTSLTAEAGAIWMSADMADYYYGILDEEVARGVAAYSPGSAITPRIGITLLHPLGRRWQLMASAEYRMLADELQDSPLLEPGSDGVGRLMLGIARRF